MYDIAIVGLGPAGANFARLIDTNKYRVAAIDKKTTTPGSFAKPCGGLLAPDAQKALAKLNLPLPGEVLVSPQIFYVKTIDVDNGLQRNYQRFYININRHKFDFWLLSLIPKTVDVFPGSSVIRINKEDELYSIVFARDGKTQAIRTKYVIGADGANGIVSKTFLAKREGCLKLAAQEWYEQGEGNPFFLCIFDSENPDSYSWFLPKGDCFIFGGAYEKGEARSSFERQKLNLRRYGITLGKPIKREACFLYRLKGPGDFHLGKDRILMLGEAAGFISPSSYEGISGALESSYLLSALFNHQADTDILKRYKRATSNLRAKYTLKILKSNVLNNRHLRKLIMKSGLQSMEVTDQG